MLAQVVNEDFKLPTGIEIFYHINYGREYRDNFSRPYKFRRVLSCKTLFS